MSSEMAAEGSVAERIKDLQFLLSTCQVLVLGVERQITSIDSKALLLSSYITGVSALLEFCHRCGSLCVHLERGTVFSCGDDGTGYVAQGQGIITYFGMFSNLILDEYYW